MSATGSSEPARADWFREVLKYKGIRPCIPGPEVAWQGRLLRKAPLRTPQPDQAHVRRAEGLAPHRDPLRPMRQDLPLRRRTRRYRPLLTLKVKASGPWNSSASTRRGSGPRDPARDGRLSPQGDFPALPGARARVPRPVPARKRPQPGLRPRGLGACMVRMPLTRRRRFPAAAGCPDLPDHPGSR